MERGRLILFVSYAPATGKSSAMLRYAKDLVKKQIKVNIASANWRGRIYTSSLANDISYDSSNATNSTMKTRVDYSVLSKEISDYVIFDEASFISDKGVEIISVIETTLEKGISVLTTINMQKFDEVNAVCRDVININVRKTIPISFLQKADEIYYLNPNVDEVIYRYKYLPNFQTKKKYNSREILLAYKNTAEHFLKNYDYKVAKLCDEDKEICNEAMLLADKGFWVEPLWCRSKYRIKEFNATKNIDKIKTYWQMENCANLALPLSSRFNNLIVFDIDIKGEKNGLKQLSAWEKKNGAEFPMTAMVETGTGGFHLYYKNRTGKRIKCIKDVLPGIDIRAEYGYIVVPPSIHPNGNRYRWVYGNLDTMVDSEDVIYHFLEENDGLF